MRVLGLDTSTMVTSAAVVVDDGGAVRVLAQAHTQASTHSENLLVVIDGVLADAGLTLADLDGIAVGAGPGSFTGLRIGMATAKGLAFAAGLPLWAVSSLAALAVDAAPASPGHDRVVAAVSDARRGEVFCGCYRVGGAPGARRVDPIGDERALPPAELAAMLSEVRTQAPGEPLALVGEGLAVYADQLADALDGIGAIVAGAPVTPRGAAVAELALGGDLPDVLTAGGPTYIRPAEAEVKFPDGNPGGTFSPRR